MNRAQQLLQVLGRVRRVRDAVHGFLDAFGATSRRHVAEAPHAPHGAAVQTQRNRVPLENSPVLEVQHVEAVGLRLGVALLNAVHKELRIHELVLDVLDQPPPAAEVVVSGNQRRLQLPDFLEAAVVGDDLAIQIDDQDPVGGGFECGLQDGARERIDDSTGFLRPRLRLGRTLSHGPNLWVGARVTSLTGAKAYRI